VEFSLKGNRIYPVFCFLITGIFVILPEKFHEFKGEVIHLLLGNQDLMKNFNGKIL